MIVGVWSLLFLTLAGAWTAQASSAAELSAEQINAPIEQVGSGLQDWLQFLGPTYELAEPKLGKNLHSGEPEVGFLITDGQTAVQFVVNLVSKAEFIVEIESVSQEFLGSMGMDEIAYDEAGNALSQDCWDGGCNELRAHRTSEGVLSAVWTYYWD